MGTSVEVEKPLVANYVGGWGNDLVTLLFGDVPRDDKPFAALCQKVLKDVHFACVLFAKYSWGTVAIDCNDCSTWLVDVPEDVHKIDFYLKLQYTTQPEYFRQVFPFTYIPIDVANFHKKLPAYRDKYQRTPKTAPAWGRFIAVSLDRYHIAAKMRKMGLPGGQYCISPTGYETHALDAVKPRERMPFDEYLDHMCHASSIIDPMGFGELTHRIVESFAIGIPVIRPRLRANTADPIRCGQHYLDCGHQGEHLQECIEAVQDPVTRHMLIENGRAWYEYNASPDGIRRTFNQQLELYREYASGKLKYTPSPIACRRIPGRHEMMELVGLAGKSCVEVGVSRGEFARHLAKRSPSRLLLVDPWCHQDPKQYADPANFPDDEFNRIYKGLVEEFKNQPFVQFDRAYSLDAAARVPDGSLDFVYIDANHAYEFVKQDIEAWYPKVKKGGWLCGHDYDPHPEGQGWPGVKKAVHEFLAAKGLALHFISNAWDWGIRVQ
jgi:hypothetical protein